MEKHIKIKVNYTYDFEEDDNYMIKQDIKDGLAERLGLSPEDIDVEIE